MSKIGQQKIKDFLRELSNARPTPGGGSTAALVAAFAAGLIEMVVWLTIEKREAQKFKKRLMKVKKAATKYRSELLGLGDKDTAAFNQVIKAYRLSKQDKSKKDKIQEALKQAALVPLKTAVIARELQFLAKELVGKGNKNARSDALSALYFAQAAKRSAIENISINLSLIKDRRFKTRVERALRQLR